MNRFTKLALLSLVLLLVAAPALAEEAGAAAGAAGRTVFDIWPFGITFGCGMIIIGAAYGISKIGSCAVESMARQPEVATSINTAMIISAALIEGITFFALIVCLLRLFFTE